MDTKINSILCSWSRT